MTVDRQPTGAVTTLTLDWHAIDWQKVHKEVRRLQVRIVKAVQAGKWGKVKSLQHLLTRSFSAKALAVRRVTENQGKRTPGVDGELWDTPEKKALAITQLRQRGYHPQPLRRIYIPKRNGKKRPLSIPTMKDRAMQALYLLALEPIAETLADPNSYGFRKHRSTADAIGQCFIVFTRRGAAQWILEADIKSCFDQISHTWLLEHIPMETCILQQWLQAGYMEKHMFHPTTSGTPQGGIISPVLANMALDGLEKELRKAFPRHRKQKVNFVRYADDFIITGKSKAFLVEEVQPLVDAFLAERGLSLSHEKTCITHIEEGFDFLSQNIRTYNGKLLIKPAKSAIKRFLDGVRELIKSNPHTSAGRLISQLNPRIRGWTTYHRHVVSKETFKHVDYAIFKALWNWARRRHPQKRKRWIKDRYWQRVKQRNWVFSGQHADVQKRLFYASYVHIVRHVKVRANANPFDPEWEIYFEKRMARKMLYQLSAKRKLVTLWREQQGACLVCCQVITKETGWHVHHIVPLSLGGQDTQHNRVLLHPNCHRQVHSKKLSVEKPRSSPSVRKA